MKKQNKEIHAIFYKEYPYHIDSKLFELGHGPTASSRRCKKYARANGYIVGTHPGHWAPGGMLSRINCNRMRKFIIVVDSLSRVGKNKEEIDAFCKEVHAMGESIVSLGYDLTLPAKGQHPKPIRA